VNVTRSCLALVLFLHVLVHPLVHAVPLPAAISGTARLSAALTGESCQTHDCQLCRDANRFAPTMGFAVPAACACSSPVVTDLIPEIFSVARFQFFSRAPPVS
jgi:hypothetical protein